MPWPRGYKIQSSPTQFVPGGFEAFHRCDMYTVKSPATQKGTKTGVAHTRSRTGLHIYIHGRFTQSPAMAEGGIIIIFPSQHSKPLRHSVDGSCTEIFGLFQMNASQWCSCLPSWKPFGGKIYVLAKSFARQFFEPFGWLKSGYCLVRPCWQTWDQATLLCVEISFATNNCKTLEVHMKVWTFIFN